jgi:hypothetical protein
MRITICAGGVGGPLCFDVCMNEAFWEIWGMEVAFALRWICLIRGQVMCWGLLCR